MSPQQPPLLSACSGNIGALAGKPVMEGKAVLFKKFADLDAFDIEINQNDAQKLVDIVVALEPTFGGEQQAGAIWVSGCCGGHFTCSCPSLQFTRSAPDG
jgi:hypothetical protein